MDRTSIDWTGAIPAITTPFRSDGAIDEAALAENIDRLIGDGAAGVVAGGCTGEFWALTMAERAALAAAAVKAVAGRGPSIIGAGAIRAEEAIELSWVAREVDAAAILVTPPFFAHLTRREIVAHFVAVDAAAATPIVLYNIPGNAGNAITPEIASELADLDKVVAIKESSGDWVNFHKTLEVARDRIRVFCGPSSVFGVPAALAGADGLMDCFPNIWSPGGQALWHTVAEGRISEAWALQRTGQALTELCVSGGRTLYPSTKAAMDHLGYAGGGAPRPPLLALEAKERAELCAGLDRILGRSRKATRTHTDERGAAPKRKRKRPQEA